MLDPCVLITITDHSVRDVLAHLKPLLQRGEPIYVPQALARAAYLDAKTDPQLANGLREGTAPLGGYASLLADDISAGKLNLICPDNQPAWRVIDTFKPASVAWTIIQSMRLGRLVSGRTASLLQGEDDRVALVQRHC